MGKKQTRKVMMASLFSSLARLLVRKFTPIKGRIFVGNCVRKFRRSRNIEFIKFSEEISKMLDKVVVVQELTQTRDSQNMEVLILCSLKHLDKLAINIDCLRKIYDSELKITILHQDMQEVKSFARSLTNTNTFFLNESVFKQDISKLDSTLRRFNPDRYTWLLQQCLKILYVGQSETPVLILDCDTLITHKIHFQAGGRSLLFVGSKTHSEFHYPYSIQVRKFLGKSASPINFVHHCQLQHPEIINEIYSQNLLSGLEKWLRKGLVPFEFSSVSEFQTYGEFMLQRYPETITLYSHEHHLQGVDEKQKSYKQMAPELSMHLSRNCQKPCDLLTWYFK